MIERGTSYNWPSFPLIGSLAPVSARQYKYKKKKRRLRVLLVEDTPIIQKANTMLLEALNCEVIVAKNGVEAVKKSQQNYDLVFMDLDLPDIDGITVSKLIRKQPHHIDTPISALTASGKAREQECLKVGMNDFICKPLMMERLQSVLATWRHSKHDWDN